MTPQADIKTDANRPKTGKLILQMAIGAAMGGSVTYAILTTVGKTVVIESDPARIVAVVLGVLFLLMGVFVGLGTVAPKAGAHLLNVEDESELREQRAALSLSAISCVFMGGMLLALGLAATDGVPGVIPAWAAAVAAGSCMVALAGLSYFSRDDYDELIWVISGEASAWAMYASLTLFILWGSLAHLGYAEWISPLGLVCALIIIELVAIMIACGRRGLLKTR